MKRHSSPRLPTFDYLGLHRYSLTCCTFQRRRVFGNADIVDRVWRCFLSAAAGADIALLAYCFMPDHLHLVAAGEQPSSDVRAFVSKAKQASAFAHQRRFGGERLWQRSYWDRVLRREEDTWTVVRYVLANPVRAGLVSHPLEYPFSGSGVYGRETLMEAFAIPVR
jgi:putative transposase